MKYFFIILTSILIVVSCKKKADPTPVAESDPISEYGLGVYDIDSNFYKTVIIHNVGEWMAENLKACHFANGDSIPSGIKTVDISGFGSPQFFFYPNGDSLTNLKKYGRLYTYYVVEDGRSVCPTGWHVPIKSEMDTLVKYVGGAGGESEVGGYIKSTSYWASPNTGANNASLLNGLPAGFRLPDGTYVDVTKTGIWWVNTPDTADRMWTFYARYLYSNIFQAPANKKNAYSIRCKRN